LPDKIPVSAKTLPGLVARLVDGVFASQWSSKIASPKLVLELVKESGRIDSSALSRAPALGWRWANGKTCSSKTTSRET
jgi:hypothetical protein